MNAPQGNDDLQVGARRIALKLSLLSRGVHASPDALKDVGTKYKENNYGYNNPNRQVDPSPKVSLPVEIVIDSSVVASYRHRPMSPYRVVNTDAGLYLLRGAEALGPVAFTARPRFYDLATRSGIPMNRVASAYGANAVVFMILNHCQFFTAGVQCHFCSLDVTFEKFRSVELRKRARDVIDVVRALGSEPTRIEHINLIGGSLLDHDREFQAYIDLVRETCRACDLDHLDGCVVCMPPQDLRLLETAFEAGIRSVKFSLEVFDPAVFERTTPGKARYGRERMLAALEYAVGVFGRGNVSSNLLLGLEPEASARTGFHYLAARGITPVAKVFHPDEGTPLENAVPWGPMQLLPTYFEVAEAYKLNGLTPWLSPMALRGDVSWEVHELLRRCSRDESYQAVTEELRALGEEP